MLRLCAAIILALLMTHAGVSQAPQWWSSIWDTDFSKSAVDFNEITDVIGKDNIPAIDEPAFMPAADETRIPGREPVISFAYQGVARAYPLRYLVWHEIVNDTVAGLPVAVTYCPLCNTSIVFERVLDGKPVTFGTTGKLRHSDLIMYDRGEETWWQQFDGKAIVGKRVGEKLSMRPSALITFDMFKQRYPGGEVLLPDPRRVAMAGQNPYVDYDSSVLPFLFRGELPKDVEPMLRVALVQEPQPVAVALAYLIAHQPYRHGDLMFRWRAGQASALDTSRIADGRDVGSIEVFHVSPDGTETPAVYTVTFAFAARAFVPGLEIVHD